MPPRDRSASSKGLQLPQLGIRLQDPIQVGRQFLEIGLRGGQRGQVWHAFLQVRAQLDQQVLWPRLRLLRFPPSKLPPTSLWLWKNIRSGSTQGRGLSAAQRANSTVGIQQESDRKR